MRNRRLLRTQTHNHVGGLTHFHLHSWWGRLPNHHIYSGGSVRPIFNKHPQSAALELLLRFGCFLPHHVRHHHFAPLDRKSHRRQRAEERHRRQNERQQGDWKIHSSRSRNFIFSIFSRSRG